MFLKIIKPAFLFFCAFFLLITCKKESVPDQYKNKILRDKIIGEYKYISCLTAPQHINDTGDLRIMTTCDSIANKILVVSKSEDSNQIDIYMEDKTSTYTLFSDSSFDVYPVKNGTSLGKFYKKDSIMLRRSMHSATQAFYMYFGKKVK
jgi:hypothetical protein